MPQMNGTGMNDCPGASPASTQAVRVCKHDSCGEQPELPGSYSSYIVRLDTSATLVAVLSPMLRAKSVAFETPPLRTTVSLQSQLRV
jgi:hypothetical protein